MAKLRRNKPMKYAGMIKALINHSGEHGRSPVQRQRARTIFKKAIEKERVARKLNLDLYNREDYIDKLMREDKSMTRRKAIRAWNEKLADQSTHREMEEGQEVIAVKTRTSISHTQSIEARRQIAGEKALDGPGGLLARFFFLARRDSGDLQAGLRPRGWQGAAGPRAGAR